MGFAKEPKPPVRDDSVPSTASAGSDLVTGEELLRIVGRALLVFLTCLGSFAVLRLALPSDVAPALLRALTLAVVTASALIGVGVAWRERGDRRALGVSEHEPSHAARSRGTPAVEDRLRAAARELADTERALEVSNASLRALLDTAVDGIVTIDEIGVIESVNRATEQLFGRDAEELIGQNVKVLMPAPFRQEHDGYLANYRETGDRRIIGIGREVLGQRKDGSTFPIDLAVNEVTQGGQRRFMGVIRDMTDRKQADEALRRERDFAEHLLDTAPVIVMALDPAGRIVRSNRFLEQACGLSRADLVGYDWVEKLIPPHAQTSVRSRFGSADGSVGALGPAMPIIAADGAERQIEWVDTTLRAADGGSEGTLIVGVDVSERLRLEGQFRQVEKMDAIGRLAGGIAHDFNTLLGSITGYSEMLLERLSDDPALRRPAEQVYRCADRGAALTRQLLAFSRQHVIDPQTLDLGVLLLEMEDMLDRLSGDDVELRFDVKPSAGHIWADAGQIEQVVMNLVVNAIDAMPRGGRVTVTADSIEIDGTCPDCGAELEAGRYARIWVRDTGFGMDAETQQRIFEPFFTTKERGRGTGLGLATVYGIVQQSRGCIGVDSEPDAGTIFRICLPSVVGKEADGGAAPVASSAAAVGERRRQATETVLLVEDDPTFLELLEEVLREQGYRVHAVGSPSDALAKAEALAQPPDLLVSDIVMPGMTGTELARGLARRFPSLQVLLMSGYTDEDLEARGARNEHVAYIQKPFTTAQLLHLVRDVLDLDRTATTGVEPAAGDRRSAGED